MTRVQADHPDWSRQPPSHGGPQGAHDDSEPLLRPQNPTYGTIERGEIDAKVQRRFRTKVKALAAFFFCAVILLVLGPWAYESLNAGRHKRLRRQWAEEKNDWAITREAWAAEARQHEAECAEEEKHWAITREAWAAEARKHEAERAAMQEEHRKWDRERWEKEEKERREQEEEARKRASIAWVGLEPGHCLRYRLKEYTATLSHVPLGVDAIEQCWNKSIEIHGRQWLPSQCEDQGLCGRVTGHWQVDMNELSCTPTWGYPTDKGCVESGIRRYENRLENLQDLSDWPIICRTAPTNIGGTWYEGPTSCEHWGNEIWGIWLINDDACR